MTGVNLSDAATEFPELLRASLGGTAGDHELAQAELCVCVQGAAPLSPSRTLSLSHRLTLCSWLS